MSQYILALDQGTTSSRAILFDDQGQPVAQEQQEFRQIFPSPGHVEHDPKEIWESQLTVARSVLANSQTDADNIAAIGITNQRETIVLWERETGKTIGNAIVWQSRISNHICDRLKAEGLEQTIREKTGLVLDPYFSGTKLTWLLENDSELKSRASRGEILCGTIDSYLIWKLTGGKSHVTDVSNASRTLLFDIHTQEWCDELLKIFGVPRAMLPEVVDSSGVVAHTDPEIFGKSIPIAGVAGDQQAATFGQICFEPGMAKNTYGTGCFMLMNIGNKPRVSENGLLTTIGWRINGETVYCLEGSIFIAGAAIQWLRDGLEIISSADQTEQLATSVSDTGGVYFVPAFVGLGAPYWDAEARGLMIGLTRGTTRAHIVRAALESIAYQTYDVLDAMKRDSGINLAELRVDGGATANDFLMQYQADILQTAVHRPVIQETTALGAAYLAGLGVGVWESQAEIAKKWTLDKEFNPQIDLAESQGHLTDWHRAIERSQGWQK
ncbi:MAG: glycerol kinase GlpK [Planctomycetaceae bacterium]|nr:glycerol kinase GlpK [Planctomycetaceae bacterium]